MANQFFVPTAQYGPGLQQAAGAVDEFGQKQYMDRAKQALQAAVQSGDPMQMRQAAAEFPEISETMQQMYNFTNDQTRQIASEGYRRALSDPDNMADILEATAETIGQFGGQPIVTMKDAELARRDPQKAMRNIQMGLAAVDPDLYDRLYGGAGQQAPAGVREFEALLQAAQSDDPVVSKAARIKLRLDPGAGTLSAEQRTALDEDLKRRVGELERLQSGEREAGKQAVVKSGEAFERLGQVRSTIPKYDRAIELVRQGANTGALASRLPSITASAIELDNLQSQLGLDVISNTTFGALSEGELNLALQTALPTGLEGDDLIEWLESRKESQQKLARYLEEAAQFLGTPGNTVAEFMRMKREGDDGGQVEQDEGTVNWSDL